MAVRCRQGKVQKTECALPDPRQISTRDNSGVAIEWTERSRPLPVHRLKTSSSKEFGPPNPPANPRAPSRSRPPHFARPTLPASRQKAPRNGQDLTRNPRISPRPTLPASRPPPPAKKPRRGFSCGERLGERARVFHVLNEIGGSLQKRNRRPVEGLAIPGWIPRYPRVRRERPIRHQRCSAVGRRWTRHVAIRP